MSYTNNFIMKKTITGFSINAKDWFYEGQMVNIKDKKHGLLSNVIIFFVGDDNSVTVMDTNEKKYFFNLAAVESITCVERRKVSNL